MQNICVHGDYIIRVPGIYNVIPNVIYYIVHDYPGRIRQK